MTYTIDTTIMGPSRLNGEAFGEWLVDQGAPIPEDARAYGRSLETWAPIIGVRGEIAAGQALQETYYPPNGPNRKPLASRWARERRNYAGMGVTGDPTQNEASPTFATVEDFAIAQLLHLRLYAKGLSLPDGHPELKNANPRRQNAIDTGYVGKAPTIRGLANTWAKDPAYATGIVAHMNRLETAGVFADTSAGGVIVPDTPSGDTTVSDTITFGQVPQPAAKQIDTSRKPAGVGWDDLGQRNPKFVVLHRMVGSLSGTDSWFAQPNVPSLTDYGIGISAMDGTSKSGELHQYNDPRGRRSGWASGPVSGAWGDGLAIVNKYGVNAVNRDGVSLEISGNFDTPITDSEKQKIAAFMAYWWDQMKIPYTSAPINPATGISAVIFHQEFTLGTGKVCPGTVVMNAVNDLIVRATAILKQYQTGGTTTPDPLPETPVYAIPQIPSWLTAWKGEPVLHDIPGVKDGTVFATTAQYRATKDTPRLQYATSGAQKVGPDIKKGELFPVAFVFTAQDGKEYGVTKYGTRTRLEDLEVVSDVAAAA